MNDYTIKVGVNYQPFPTSYNHKNKSIMIAHFQINGIYVMQYFNININNIENFDSILNDITEFVRYLKNEWYDYDWVWYEAWEGYNLNSKNKLILDIFNIAFNRNEIEHNKLWFYISNYSQDELYGFNYVRVWPTIANQIPVFNTHIDVKIDKKIYIQGGRTTRFRNLIYDKLNKNNLLDSDKITHTLTLNNFNEGGGKNIEWKTLYKLIDESFAYVICETDYNLDIDDIRDYVHFSEKTLIPLNQYKPFVMLGGPYYLKYLKKLGFKTFSEFWNEDYDDIVDNELRIDAVIEIIKNINKKSISELQMLQHKMKPILIHNKNQFDFLKENPIIYAETLI